MKLRATTSRFVTALTLAGAFVAVACTKEDTSPAIGTSHSAGTKNMRQSDLIPTAKGGLRVMPLHHATMLLEWDGTQIYTDPVHEANFTGLPKADIVFLTDIHPDHLDAAGLASVLQDSTIVVAPPAVAELLPKDLAHLVVMKNGEKQSVSGIGVEAIPMYNLTRGPTPGTLYHDKGRGNGYVLTFADKRVYLSGDTECTPEMRALQNIDVAFVSMNLPYTMPPAEAAACVQAFRPKLVYPYHYQGSNLNEFAQPLIGQAGIEIRERDWY